MEYMDTGNIEDLGDLLNCQFSQESPTNWQGYALGYTEDDDMIQLTPSFPCEFPTSSGITANYLQRNCDISEATHELHQFTLGSPSHHLPSYNTAPTPSSTTSYSLSDILHSKDKTIQSRNVQTTSSCLENSIQPNSLKRDFASTCSPRQNKAEQQTFLEEERGVRKRCREKLRRAEVTDKFLELNEVLGLAKKTSKCTTLQEAINSIVTLKKEKENLTKEMARIQQEMSKLATCLQYSHMGAMGIVPTGLSSAANVPCLSLNQNLNQGYIYKPPVTLNSCPPLAPRIDDLRLSKANTLAPNFLNASLSSCHNHHGKISLSSQQTIKATGSKAA